MLNRGSLVNKRMLICLDDVKFIHALSLELLKAFRFLKH